MVYQRGYILDLYVQILIIFEFSILP